MNGKSQKINKIREAIEHRDLSGLGEDMLSEGEIGKLANAVVELDREYRRTMEKEIRQKEYLRDLISDISHQMKTPIASLTVFTDLLLEEAEKEGAGDGDLVGSENARRKNILLQEEQQLERMRWLTQSMLQLARLEAESVEFDKRPTGLQQLCNIVAASFRQQAEEKNVDLLVTGDETELLTDPDWLQEALGNVVKNAIEYSPDGGTVEIRVEKTPVATRIFVQDEGEGIPEQDRLRIFERFYRVNGRSVNPSSVGIGLALSKKIVAGCGGKLYVQSRHRSECNEKENPYTRMVFAF